MNSPKQWFFRGAQLAAIVLSLATPGCLAETDDIEDVTAFEDGPLLEDQAVDPGLDYDRIDEPALELMAEGQRVERKAWNDPPLEPSVGGPSMDAELIGHEGEDDGEPTPQPWHAAANEEPGDEGGPDPVPWDVASLGPDPIPWHNDDDLKASANGQTKGRQAYDPN